MSSNNRIQHWSWWMRGISICGVVSLCLSIIRWGPIEPLLSAGPLVVVLAFTGMAFVMAVTAVPKTDESLPRHWWIKVACACGCAPLTVGVVGSTSAPLAFSLLVLFAATSPPASDLSRRALGKLTRSTNVQAHLSLSSADHDPEPDKTNAGEVGVMSTTELCQVWRATFWLMREHGDPARVMRLAELRRRVLDELEARHPVEVQHWMRSNHHGADGPARYLKKDLG